MSAAPRSVQDGLAVLSLQFQVLDDRPDWPVVQIQVNGANPFAETAPDWRGFDPAKLLGPNSPLLPVDGGRRVAVYRCSCGEAGCGVIAPVIVPSPDGRRVSWVDFRDFTGVFTSPVAPSATQYEGKPWDLADLHFDRERYLSEVLRAFKDVSWETRCRKTARLLRERLETLGLVMPGRLELAWVEPAWSNSGGVTLMFQRLKRGSDFRISQRMLELKSDADDPAAAAADMAQRLLGVDPDDWVAAFGYKPTLPGRPDLQT